MGSTWKHLIFQDKNLKKNKRYIFKTNINFGTFNEKIQNRKQKREHFLINFSYIFLETIFPICPISNRKFLGNPKIARRRLLRVNCPLLIIAPCFRVFFLSETPKEIVIGLKK